MNLMGVLCVLSIKEISSRPRRASGVFAVCSFSEHVRAGEMKGHHEITKEIS